MSERTRTEPAAGDDTYATFVAETQGSLRHALVAAFGVEAGREATADALAYGWANWERLRKMENPAGYLFRVGQRKARRGMRPRLLFPALPADDLPWVEPKLPGALRQLTKKQRVAVVLVHGFAMTQKETGELLGITPGSVQRHVERGLHKLRNAMGVEQ